MNDSHPWEGSFVNYLDEILAVSRFEAFEYTYTSARSISLHSSRWTGAPAPARPCPNTPHRIGPRLILPSLITCLRLIILCHLPRRSGGGRRAVRGGGRGGLGLLGDDRADGDDVVYQLVRHGHNLPVGGAHTVAVVDDHRNGGARHTPIIHTSRT